MENKAMIAEKLADVLKLTRAGKDLETIEYWNDECGAETAVCFMDGGEYQIRVNVSADSGAAMIEDIVKALLD